jgi:hypothetical protein
MGAAGGGSEDTEDRAKGSISTEFTFWCGACEHWHQYAAASKREASGWARRHGWRLTRARGWLCPSHARSEGGSHGR